MALNNLPHEILLEITGHLGTDELKNTRLVSRELNEAATETLFKTVRLRPTDDSIERFEKISKVSRLGIYTNCIVIETFPDICFDSQSWDNNTDDFEDWELPGAFTPSFDALSKAFPAATAVELKFSADVVNNSNTLWKGSREPPETRGEILEAFFQSLAARLKDKDLRKIDSLTIVNLSDYAHDELTLSDDFLEVLRSLTELHLHIAIEGESASPENEINEPEFRDFMPHLRNRWLKPIAGRVTALSLYCENYWGAIPRLNVTGLEFPKLRSLALGNYTFAYQSQIDWLTSLTSLEVLILDDSPLVVLLGLAHDFISDFNIDMSGWRSLPLENAHYIVRVCGNLVPWSDYFDQIRSRLCNLKSFQFGHGAWDEEGVGFL